MAKFWSDDDPDFPKRLAASEWRSSGGVYRAIDEKAEPRRRLSMLAEVLRSLAEFRAK
jgi:hypothetical protein